MTELERISDQIQQIFEGKPAWHGPSVLQVLENVTAKQATTRPIAGAHTIWELVIHILIWEDEVRRCLEGEKLRWLSEEEDWPPIHDTSKLAWQKTIEELKRVHQLLLEALSRFDANQLNSIVPCDPAVPEPWASKSFYTMLHGIVQHAAYHAGQIALLKKG